MTWQYTHVALCNYQCVVTAPTTLTMSPSGCHTPKHRSRSKQSLMCEYMRDIIRHTKILNDSHYVGIPANKWSISSFLCHFACLPIPKCTNIFTLSWFVARELMVDALLDGWHCKKCSFFNFYPKNSPKGAQISSWVPSQISWVLPAFILNLFATILCLTTV